MLRIWWALALLLFVPANCNALCSGQSVEQRVLLEDDFTRSSANWDQGVGIRVGDGKMDLVLGTDDAARTVLNRATTVPGGDFCIRFTLPEPEDDNGSSASLVFWARDVDNLYTVDFWSNGNISVGRTVSGKWTEMLSLDDSSRAWKGPDDVSELRVLAVTGQVKIWLNGELIRSVDIDSPRGNLRFGVFIEMDKAPATPKFFQFSYFNVLQPINSFGGGGMQSAPSRGH